ncbi:MAG: threonine synthase, partial [Ruthenibacterium sp.]
MQYTSTRNDLLSISAAEAILTGLAPDGGLFVPASFPALDVTECYGLSYPETAKKVLSLFLTDYDEAFLEVAVTQVYSDANFDGKAGFVKKVSEGTFALELWHGPTCAFKDYALQIMPKLLCEAKKLQNDTGITKILVATSGDTGKAALAGYANLPGIQIAVFYPNDGTSEIQRLQMATQEGDNVAVYAVNGNFDDAQRGVKRAFADAALAAALAQKGEALSSANSINWGRLVPQIVYYFYSYAQLVAQKEITNGDAVSFCVPTGNFGDILAGYYAKQMGLPIDKLVCASNTNNVLTDFLETGIYDANRTFYKTSSPSMDIL